MTGLFPSMIAFMVLLALVTPQPIVAQPTDMPESKSAARYHPGLGELMTAFVQPRHIKLGLAVNEQNWRYASFELGELTEAFDDIAELVPKHDNLPIPEMIASIVKQPMEALGAAIKTMDNAAYTKAYADSQLHATHATRALTTRRS